MPENGGSDGGASTLYGAVPVEMSKALRTPSGPPSALTQISRKSYGRPIPPWPETPPMPLSPANSVMLRAITSVFVGSVPRTPASSSASRIAAGDQSVTSSVVDWIWPTRRSPIVSVSTIGPSVCSSIRPEPSGAERTWSSSQPNMFARRIASTLLKTVNGITVASFVLQATVPWQSTMLWPALASVNVYALGNVTLTWPNARSTSVR